jgi:hypothetical protein
MRARQIKSECASTPEHQGRSAPTVRSDWRNPPVDSNRPSATEKEGWQDSASSVEDGISGARISSHRVTYVTRSGILADVLVMTVMIDERRIKIFPLLIAADQIDDTLAKLAPMVRLPNFILLKMSLLWPKILPFRTVKRSEIVVSWMS